MELSETQKILVEVLQHCGASIDLIVGVSVLLKDKVWEMEELILWIEERNPELQKMSPKELAEITEMALTLSETSPQESEQE